MKYQNYEEFNRLTGFEKKAGFSLKPLQATDVDTLVAWGRGLLGYEVGGGKTVVSTAASLMLDADVTIITCPPVLSEPWCNWLNKVSERVVHYLGPTRKKLDLSECRWIVMSHNLFRDDFDLLMAKLQGRKLDMIVDEAHYLKNTESILYQKVLRAVGERNCFQLTGTPTSKPEDTYAYIRMNTPHAYRDYNHFIALHLAGTSFFGQKTDWHNLDLMAENLHKRYLKRSKFEIHGYVNTPLYPDTSYSLSKDHYKLYIKLLEEQLLLLPEGKIDATTPQRMYHAMQQIVINYDHFSGDPTKRSVAYDVIDSVIDQTQCARKDSSKLIIWTNYRLTAGNVTRYCQSLGINTVAAYSGADSSKSTKAFMENPEVRILVAHPGSAGAGLNPQHVCWESLFLELSTIPLQTRQAIGRVDRVGQNHVPTIRFGKALGTIQIKLLSDLLDKSDQVDLIERTPTKESLRRALMGEI